LRVGVVVGATRGEKIGGAERAREGEAMRSDAKRCEAMRRLNKK
jgi:hypothetical protein